MAQQDTSPLVSIIVRTVNRPRYLEECLNSLIQQDYRKLEVILVNDGGPSVRGIFQSVEQHFQGQLIEIPFNVGRSISGNIGLEHAAGEYIGFLDDDDIYYPFHLSTLVTALHGSSYRVAYTDAFKAEQIVAAFDRDTYITTKHVLDYFENFSRKDLFRRNYIPILCVLFSRRCLDSGVKFDQTLEVLEDWDFWAQLAIENDFLHIPQITSEYRVRTDNSNTLTQNSALWDWSRKYMREKYNELFYKTV